MRHGSGWTQLSVIPAVPPRAVLRYAEAGATPLRGFEQHRLISGSSGEDLGDHVKDPYEHLRKNTQLPVTKDQQRGD